MCTDKLQEILVDNKSFFFFHNSPLKLKPIKIPLPVTFALCNIADGLNYTVILTYASLSFSR